MIPVKQSAFARKIILVVEDSRLMRHMIRDLLLESGFHVQTAGSAAQALRLLQIQTPHLALLDLNLPDVSGLELLPAIKLRHADLPVILLTSNRDTNDKVRGLRLGAADYITKPYVPEELVARIDVHLRLAERHDAWATMPMATVQPEYAQPVFA